MPPPPQLRLHFASILRLLWHARLLVAVGAALGLIAGTLLVYSASLGVPPKFERRGDRVGVASTEVLVDSKGSQAVDLGEDPVVIDIPGLIARARLLANLIATSPLREEIARRARIDPATFLATAPSIGSDSPTPETSAPERLNVMSATLNEQLPIVTINTESPDEATAARIASTAAAELTRYLHSLAAQDNVRGDRQLVVKPLSALHATVHRGPRRLLAVVAFAFVFGLWCIGIVFVSRFRRGWREADPTRAAERGAGSAWADIIAVPAASAEEPARGLGGTKPGLWAVPERPERPEQRTTDVSA
jgi:hypothetical protein